MHELTAVRDSAAATADNCIKAVQARLQAYLTRCSGVCAATYPVLSLVGHSITSIPVTSIPCERVFSTTVTARLASSFSSPQAVYAYAYTVVLFLVF